jgi:predicted ATPase
VFDCQIAGLTDDGIRSFVDEWMGQSAPANLIRFLTKSTRGNPLFMTEMLRHLSETGMMANTNVLGAGSRRQKSKYRGY